jgi:hypothetical protein
MDNSPGPQAKIKPEPPWILAEDPATHLLALIL